VFAVIGPPRMGARERDRFMALGGRSGLAACLRHPVIPAYLPVICSWRLFGRGLIVRCSTRTEGVHPRLQLDAAGVAASSAGFCRRDPGMNGHEPAEFCQAGRRRTAWALPGTACMASSTPSC
jgi:hypothetical protein